MPLVHTQHSIKGDTPSLEVSQIRKIELSHTRHINGIHWIIRFYASDDTLLGSWFYASEQERASDLLTILKINPLTISFGDSE